MIDVNHLSIPGILDDITFSVAPGERVGIIGESGSGKSVTALTIMGLSDLPAEGSVTVDGAVPIRDLNRAMDWSLPDEEATTVAGLVIHEARTIPDAGQAFTFHGFRFQVLRKSRNRITTLKIMPLQQRVRRAAE